MTDSEFSDELSKRLDSPEGNALAKRIARRDPLYFCPECGTVISESYHRRGYRCDGCADNAECQGMLYEGRG